MSARNTLTVRPPRTSELPAPVRVSPSSAVTKYSTPPIVSTAMPSGSRSSVRTVAGTYPPLVDTSMRCVVVPRPNGVTAFVSRSSLSTALFSCSDT